MSVCSRCGGQGSRFPDNPGAGRCPDCKGTGGTDPDPDELKEEVFKLAQADGWDEVIDIPGVMEALLEYYEENATQSLADKAEAGRDHDGDQDDD